MEMILLVCVILAPGLLALIHEMQKLGNVLVLAPDRNWSAGGHVKTLNRALRVREVRLMVSDQPLKMEE